MTELMNGPTPAPDKRTGLTSDLALFFLITSAVFWLGGINCRALLGDSLLETGTTTFLPNLVASAEIQTYRLIGVTTLLIDGAYLIVFISAIVFLCSTPMRMKEQGWLLMSAILFFLFSPAEAYTTWLDWKFYSAIRWGNGDLSYLRTLFVERIAALRGVPFIAMLSYYTIIGLAVWRPFVRTAAPVVQDGEWAQ